MTASRSATWRRGCSTPRWLAAGRLTNGAYDWPGVRNVTAVYQDLALAARARPRSTATSLRFAGMILAPGYLDTAEAKRHAAEASAELAATMGADAAICTTFSSGNSHTDTMLTVRACEARGVATAALVCETNGGLTDHVAEADLLIEHGQRGRTRAAVGARSRRRRAARSMSGEAVPMVHYLGSCGQTGDARWTAVPA